MLLSVVLPVHDRIEAHAFDACLESVFSQTRRAEEVVVVEDGPLGAELSVVLTNWARKCPELLRVRLPRNGGQGVANQAGLSTARGDWIVKVDADDICVPHRFERQLEFMLSHDLTLGGAAMLEFDGEPSNITRLRQMPLSHDAIVRRARWNNPINHPTAIFRRESALACGGYRPVRHVEDYDLVIRLMTSGARLGNLAEPLVLFNASQVTSRRAISRSLVESELFMRRTLRDAGVWSGLSGWLVVMARLVARCLLVPVMTKPRHRAR